MPVSASPDTPLLHRLGVVVEAPQHAGLWGPLDYLCDRPLPAGTLVRVPFGRRVVTGVVWWGGDEVAPDATVDPAQLKEVAEVLDIERKPRTNAKGETLERHEGDRLVVAKKAHTPGVRVLNALNAVPPVRWLSMQKRLLAIGGFVLPARMIR